MREVQTKLRPLYPPRPVLKQMFGYKTFSFKNKRQETARESKATSALLVLMVLLLLTRCVHSWDKGGGVITGPYFEKDGPMRTPARPL